MLKAGRRTSRNLGLSACATALFFFWVLSLLGLHGAHAQGPVPPEDLPYSFDDLGPCGFTSVELAALDRTASIEPCIYYDNLPELLSNNATDNNQTTIITVVGVFSTTAGYHRDGGLIAVQQINQGRGAPIGYYKDYYIKIRLVIGIAGHRTALGPASYTIAHTTLLQVLLEGLRPQYIFGTSSFDSEPEREYAGAYQTMLLAQVGPQAYFTSNRSNDHVFGAHIPSEGYGIPAFQALRFSNAAQPQKQKIRVVYRDRSEFFYSTCRAVYDKALEQGYNKTTAIEYNPEADHDNNGVLNQEDPAFLRGLADQACSVDEAQGDDKIAVWGCFLTDLEVNVFLEQLRANGCRLSSLWLTVASWAWPNKYPEAVPFLQSGGQWHASMQYGDEYFPNGQAMLDHFAQQFGYQPSYAALGSYHQIYLMYANIRSFFKGKDEPAVEETFASPEGYEELRRAMLDLSLQHTLYGPTSFDEHRRNVGRGSAGMQWNTPIGALGGSSTSIKNDPNNEKDDNSLHDGFQLLLVSPIDQATSAVVFPAPSSEDCPPGSFVNSSRLVQDPSLLSTKCDLCAQGTFQDDTNADPSCRVCAAGSSTDGQTGANICVEMEDNLVPTGLHVFGYFVVAIVYGLALGFATWTIRHKNDPVVRIGQLEFLLMLCLGPIISSSSIIALSFQAGSLEDDTAASRACSALPFLYSTGWMLQYGSLSAKSYRMYTTTRAAESVQGRTVTAFDTYIIVALLLLLNYAIVIPWAIVDPVVWERHDKGTAVDAEAGVLTFESYGRCTSNHLRWWTGAMLALHFLIMIVTNCLLYQIRNISDRYQESKYVAMASVYACEFLIVGIPILIAVGENAVEASYIVLVCIIGLSDIGILLMMFLPKIRAIRKGLPEGVSVGQSIFKKNPASRAHSNVMGESSVQCSNDHVEESRRFDKGNRSNNSSFADIVMDAVTAEPVVDSEEAQKEELKKQEEGALVNNMTLQW